MAKMKQLWCSNNIEERLRDRVEIREVDIPEVMEYEVKVKIAFAAICATDVHRVTMDVFARKSPFRLGHQASGVIEEIGPGFETYGFKVGDKVCLYPVSSCGLCELCKKGHRQYCNNGRLVGAFAEYVIRHVSAINKIPDDADLQKYSLVEPASSTVRAMDLAPIPHGTTVAVSGIGGIGSILLNQVILSGLECRGHNHVG